MTAVRCIISYQGGISQIDEIFHGYDSRFSGNLHDLASHALAFLCPPDMARSAVTSAVLVRVVVVEWLGGASPLSTRQGERLAERQRCPSRGGI